MNKAYNSNLIVNYSENSVKITEPSTSIKQSIIKISGQNNEYFGLHKNDKLAQFKDGKILYIAKHVKQQISEYEDLINIIKTAYKNYHLQTHHINSLYHLFKHA